MFVGYNYMTFQNFASELPIPKPTPLLYCWFPTYNFLIFLSPQAIFFLLQVLVLYQRPARCFSFSEQLGSTTLSASMTTGITNVSNAHILSN